MKKQKLYKSRIGILESKSINFHRINDIKFVLGLSRNHYLNTNLIIDCHDEFNSEILRHLVNISAVAHELIKKENRNKKNVSS